MKRYKLEAEIIIGNECGDSFGKVLVEGTLEEIKKYIEEKKDRFYLYDFPNPVTNKWEKRLSTKGMWRVIKENGWEDYATPAVLLTDANGNRKSQKVEEEAALNLYLSLK